MCFTREPILWKPFHWKHQKHSPGIVLLKWTPEAFLKNTPSLSLSCDKTKFLGAPVNGSLCNTALDRYLTSDCRNEFKCVIKIQPSLIFTPYSTSVTDTVVVPPTVKPVVSMFDNVLVSLNIIFINEYNINPF